MSIVNGDKVWVLCRVNRQAKDDSWLEIQVPTIAPVSTSNNRWTNSGKRFNDGWWTKTVRVSSDAVFKDK